MGSRRLLKLFSGLLLLAILGLGNTNLLADGFIIPKPRPGEVIPPLSVKFHRVKVEVYNQAAKTSIDQVFIDNHDRDLEGTYIFPLPEKAAISEFAMYIGDQKVEGEILDSDQARRVYEDIVRRMRDPALLEYIGRNLFRARVFPIPARGEKRIQLSYTEVLNADKGLVKYLYPLNTERFSFQPLREVSLTAQIESKVPITNIYSPSHKISIHKDGPHRATVGFEAVNVKPDKDFVLYYSLSQDDIGLSFMNWQGGPDEGYFMFLASPRFVEEKGSVMNKNLVLVLDSSGSMSGKKILQARDAVRFIINRLDENDRFSIVDFDDTVSLFAPELVPAASRNRENALKFVDQIEDSGGTNINEALLKALKMTEAGDRPNYILFLTDGLPTVGVTDTAEILRNIARSNESSARLFVFGVGYDVNTELLDKISSDNRGASVYVGENEDLEVAVSSYYDKMSSPLLSDLRLTFSGVEVSQSYPQTLPDLFRGSQLVVLGKYRGSGPVTILLSGRVGKAEKNFVLKGQALGQEASTNFLPRLWATRRIGYLLEEIRLRGSNPELVDEVKKLGLRYGIITPYTSFLVTEKERFALEAAAPEAADAMKAGRVTGAGAFKAAKISHQLKMEERASEVESAQVRYREDKTFYLKDGLWVDSLYVESSPLKNIKFNSDDYFRLISEHPGVAKYLSVGKNLIISYEGMSYKIID